MECGWCGVGSGEPCIPGCQRTAPRQSGVNRAAFSEIARLQEEAIKREALIECLREIIRFYNPDDAIFDEEKRPLTPVKSET